MPLLEEIHQEYPEKLQVIGLTSLWNDVSTEQLVNRKLQETEQFVSERGVTYPILIDTTSVNYDLYFIKSYPTTILIDKEGNAVDYGIGVAGAERVLDKARGMMSGT
jgi:cytochrome c-type biogenesis protein